MNPFSTSALTQFCTQVNSLLQRDLRMDADCAIKVTEDAKSLLLGEKANAFPKIARILECQGIRRKWNQILWSERSQFLAQWLNPYIVGETLDLLCGHGKVGECLANLGINVFLTEREGIYPEDWKSPDLPYILLSNLTTNLPNRKFDTVLLCTVLHHEIDPCALLSFAARIANRRIIIVENCLEREFLSDYQLLMDIFFNNCLNSTNLGSSAVHKTVEGWLIFACLYGRVIHLERQSNIPGIPLSHQLIVIEVNQ